MDLLQEISLFERRLGCRAAFHDFTGDITRLAEEGELPLHHRHPACEEMRSEPGCYEHCLHCDVRLTGKQIAFGRPFRKLCHAGLLEIVFPLLKFGAPAGVLFLGVYRPSPGLIPEMKQPHLHTPLASPAEEMPEELCWFGELFAESIRRRLEAHPETGRRDGRKERIHWWFERNFRRPEAALAELAAELGVGESRAGRLLKEEYNQSFPELLNEFRLRCAKEILSRSRLPVAEVAALTGYRSANYLFRQYRKRFGVTPRCSGRPDATRGGSSVP